jgi:hypothetical protein
MNNEFPSKTLAKTQDCSSIPIRNTTMANKIRIYRDVHIQQLSVCHKSWDLITISYTCPFFCPCRSRPFVISWVIKHTSRHLRMPKMRYPRVDPSSTHWDKHANGKCRISELMISYKMTLLFAIITIQPSLSHSIYRIDIGLSTVPLWCSIDFIANGQARENEFDRLISLIIPFVRTTQNELTRQILRAGGFVSFRFETAARARVMTTDHFPVNFPYF